MNNERRLPLGLPYWTEDTLGKKLATPRLSDEVYAASSATYVLVCVEILLVNLAERLIYLPWRKRKPCVGWWYLGGRMKRGESEHETAKRVLEREAGLVLDSDRFQYIRCHRLIAADREEIPQDAGADYLSFQFVVDITPAELIEAGRRLDGDEFDRTRGLRSFAREDLTPPEIHHSIRRLYYDAFFPH